MESPQSPSGKVSSIGRYSLVHSGGIFPLDPDKIMEEHILLPDIIYHLSMINRWNGGTSFPFSVLEHSLYCDELVQQELPFIQEEGNYVRMRLIALLHDAHESITGDIPTGAKELYPQIREFQQKYDEILWKKMGLWPISQTEKEMMKVFDDLAMLGEAREFLPIRAFFLLSAGRGVPELGPVGCSYGEKRKKARTRFANTLQSLRKELNICE